MPASDMQLTIRSRGGQRIYETNQSNTNPGFVTDIGRIVSGRAGSKSGKGFGGYDDLELKIKPHGTFLGGMFRVGDEMELTKVGGEVWLGGYSNSDPIDDDGTITIRGRGTAHTLFNYPCRHWSAVPGAPDVEYATRSIVDGMAHAITRLGLPIALIVGDLPTALAGDADGTIAIFERDDPARLLGDVLTHVLEEAGFRWWVWGRTLIIAEPNLDPLWRFDGTDTIVAVADDQFYTDIDVAFLIEGDGSELHHYGTGRASDPDGIRKFDRRIPIELDYTGIVFEGTGSGRQLVADAIAANKLDAAKGRFVLQGSATIYPDSGLKHINGGSVDLSRIRAGEAVQVNQLRTSEGHLMPAGHTFILGEATFSFDEDSESLVIAPEDAAGRDFDALFKPPAEGSHITPSGKIQPPPEP